MKKISPKQKDFADYYIETGKAEEAALKAGYAEKYARAQSYKMLENVGISEYIAKRMEQIDNNKICTLKEIQEFRSRVLRGEDPYNDIKDNDIISRLKAGSDLEKALRIKEEEEAKRKREEEARNRGEYHTDLDIVADCFHHVIRDIRNKKHREYVLRGGRGSTKSSCGSIMPYEIMMNNPDIHALALRQVGNTLRDSIYAQFVWAAEKQSENPMFDINNWNFGLSPLEITYMPTGQKIFFRGADDPGKIKSIKVKSGYIGILIFEELDQFTGPEAVRKIEQSAVRGGEEAYIFKFFNPPKSSLNWANKYAAEKKDTKLVHSSTYLDVPKEWLGQPFIDEAEHLKATNPDAYDNEYGGCANGEGGMVFDYVRDETITDEQISQFDRIYQGVDWGWYPDSYAFARVYYDHAREIIYIIDENYGCHLSNEETAEWIINKGYTDYVSTCDNAENKSIQDYVDRGIPARPVTKGPGSVEYGMKWLQRRTIVIDKERTPNAYKEITEYEYERDKDGNVISGYPDKNNHFIDAMRYSLSPLYTRRGNSA